MNANLIDLIATQSEPNYNIFNHNLDEEFTKFLDQIYAFLEPNKAKYDKFFEKMANHKESNNFEIFQMDHLLNQIDEKIVNNPAYFENQNVEIIQEIYQSISKFAYLFQEKVDKNYLSSEFIYNTFILYLKIEPFKLEILQSFKNVEENVNIDDDFHKIEDIFKETHSLLKQYKKAIEKLKNYELDFAVNVEYLQQIMIKFKPETLDFQDVKKISNESTKSMLDLISKINEGKNLKFDQVNKENVIL